MRSRSCLTALIVGLLVIVTGLPAWAAERPIQVFVNGQQLKFDVDPAVIDGRTLVPMRAIFEGLGAAVSWDQPTQTATATWADAVVVLPIGAAAAQVKGEARQLDVPAQLIGGRTMVPLRFVAEARGALVGWYGRSRLITINLPPKGLVAATVTKVTDGDTVEVQLAGGKVEKVRLIGVDTPETVHPTKGVQPYGPEASAFTKERLAGQVLQLELDVDERDQYGRLLAYLYLPNGAMFNGVLADEGYARMATFPPNVRYVEVFRALQADAQAASQGLWAGSIPPRPSRNEPPALTPVCNDLDPDPAKHCNKPDPNAPAPPTPPSSGYDPSGPDRDCPDFATHAEAQRFFEAAGGPARDLHRLDADHDGIACESLP